MKKIIYFSLVVSFCQAQNFIPRQQYLFNPNVINPAFIATQENLNIWGNYGSQLFGVAGSPQNYTFNANSPLGKNHAIGGIFSSNSIGTSFSSTAVAQYAYKLPTIGKTKVFVGLQTNISNFGFVVTNTIPPPNGYSVNRLFLNVGAGVLVNNRRFTVGFSMPQIAQNSLTLRDSAQSNGYKLRYPRSYILSSGVNFNFKENIILTPSLLVNYIKNVSPNIEGNLTLSIRNRIKFVGGFGFNRIDYLGTNDTFSLGTDIRVFKGLHVGYILVKPSSTALNNSRFLSPAQHLFSTHYEFSKKK
jgi:type IX secretion system PorP/SprF family membrane protein